MRTTTLIKAGGMLSLLSLLFVSCGEDDTPTATLPPDAAPADSTETVVPDPMPTTELVTFRATTFYYADELEEEFESMDQHYLMVSNQQGAVLAFEPYQIGESQTVSVDTVITDERLQVSLVHTGTLQDVIGDFQVLLGFSFTDVARGSDLLMDFADQDQERSLLGHASLTFENVNEASYYSGGIRTYRGYTGVEDTQMDTVIQVPIYRENTPMSVILDIDGEQYISKFDEVSVNESYTVDLSTMTKLATRTVTSPAQDHHYIHARVDGFFVKEGDLSNENRLPVGYGFGTDNSGNPIILDPGNLFPAYETSFYIDDDFLTQSVRVRGDIPEQFQLPSLSATFTETESDRFNISVEGNFDAYIGEWFEINEHTNEAILWTSIGSPATTSSRVPQLPDSLDFTTADIPLENLKIREYNHIDDHDSFLEEAGGNLYDMEDGSTRYEEVEYDFYYQNNGRQQQSKIRQLLLDRDQK